MCRDIASYKDSERLISKEEEIEGKSKNKDIESMRVGLLTSEWLRLRQLWVSQSQVSDCLS